MQKKKPIITISLIMINIAVFLCLELTGSTEDTMFMLEHGAVYPEYLTDRGEYWRLFTAMFLHFGFPHLINNMLILGAAGGILEDALGHVKYLFLYVLAGLGGSMLSYMEMLHSGDYAVSAGASGAIFGIVGALLWIVIVHKGRYESLTGMGLLFIIALTLYYGVSIGGVDNWGHIGGLLMGFVMGIILYRKKGKKIDFTKESQYT